MDLRAPGQVVRAEKHMLVKLYEACLHTLLSCEVTAPSEPWELSSAYHWLVKDPEQRLSQEK